jgi:hypothetical protein
LPELTRDNVIFAVKVPLGLGQMCFGYSMIMTITCFDHEQVCAIGCFQHRGIHYRVAMTPGKGSTAQQAAAAVALNPVEAAESILQRFVRLTPEEREKTIYGKDNDANHNRST